MKKIYLVIEDITNFGGTERVTSILCNELTDSGYNVFLCTLKSQGNKLNFSISPSVTILNFSHKNRYIAITSILFKAKKSKSPVITISMGRLSAETALLSLCFPSSKMILSEHSSFESFSEIKKIIKRISYYIANKVIVLTEHDKYIIAKDNHKFSAISNINPYYKSDIKITPFIDRENIAIAVGRFGYQKNFERLISIWKRAKIKNWKLIIIGSECFNLSPYIDDNDNIIISPPTKDIDHYYNNAKLMLMTSRYEGLPMVLIEAQHFGIPTISFDCKTGPKEIIHEDKNGYVINYSDDDGFLSKLKKLTSNDSLLYEMHINAIKNASNYSSKKIIKKWLDVIESI
ncbi:glycosyltransferase [Providencia huaxiensis]|uniref:glycosyltransferase n=1 Tax=Providencia huaxiensis TaxID=2027290 RepID=UPI000C7EA2A0|nr:glycosyltransferase [Providencia huaxiensis]AXH63516.1 glycosyltransferase family 4 protein [Providencia huaxiensis]